MIRLLAPFALLALLTVSLHAQENFDPKARAAALAPYLDDMTVGVAHVDFRRLDFKKAVTQVTAQFGIPGPPAEELDRLHKLLEQAKIKLPEAYVVVSLADVPREPPFGLLRLGKGAKPDEAMRLLVEFFDPGAGVPDEELAKYYFEKDGWLVFGSERTLERVKRLKPTPAPNLIRAFEVAGDTAAQAIALVTDDNRALVSGLVGALPPPLDDVNMRELLKGVRFAALGIDALPKTQLRLGVQAVDSAGADQVPLLTPKKKDDRVFLVLKQENGDFDALAKAFEPAIANVRLAAQRIQSTNNIRQIALGLSTYENTFRKFPPAVIRSKDGKPLHSWRVAILPYIDEEALYEQFKLDEPWDSEHNKKLIEKMPAIYANPAGLVKEKGKTLYMAPICKGSILNTEKGRKIEEVTDGTSKTVMILEAHPDKAVIWTKPDDLEVDLDKPLAGLGGVWKEGILVVFCDTHSSLLKPSIKPDVLRRLFQANDSEPVDSQDLE